MTRSDWEAEKYQRHAEDEDTPKERKAADPNKGASAAPWSFIAEGTRREGLHGKAGREALQSEKATHQKSEAVDEVRPTQSDPPDDRSDNLMAPESEGVADETSYNSRMYNQHPEAFAGHDRVELGEYAQVAKKTRRATPRGSTVTRWTWWSGRARRKRRRGTRMPCLVWAAKRAITCATKKSRLCLATSWSAPRLLLKEK